MLHMSSLPAPLRMSPPPSGSDASRNDLRLFGLVRDVGVEARDLSVCIGSVATALTIADPSERQKAMTSQLAELTTAASNAEIIVRDRFGLLTDLLDADASLYDRCGDEVLEIRNSWAAASVPEKYTPADHGVVQAQVASASKALSNVVWHAALVTVPSRVEQHLATVNVGRALDFDAAFRDELPDPAMRKDLLDYLAAHPDSISGVVDLDSGVIYKSSRHLWRRLLSYLLILGLAIPGGIAYVQVLTNGFPAAGLGAGWFGAGADRFGELVAAYAFLALGAVFHVGVEALKHGRRSTLGSFTALNDWLAWIHVRELSMLASIVVIWLTLAGLAISLPAGQLTWQVALFAGYSIDSIFALFVTRFDKAAIGAFSKLSPIVSGTP